MAWKIPKISEIAPGGEIDRYACAALTARQRTGATRIFTVRRMEQSSEGRPAHLRLDLARSSPVAGRLAARP
ncbi:hypothetical protein [Sphingobium sp.]|uniref:hypothetical protein n=1 Tax=Sphingobium sp. TaxID=1912891 RepID=UPI0035C74757